jgi:hypothetical protein
MLTLEQQRSTIFNCLNGNGIRDCGRCDAYHAKGGVCCFGRSYEPGDADCTRCRHRTDCERLSHSYQPPQRTTYASGPQPRYITPTSGPQRPTGPLPVPQAQPIVQIQPKVDTNHPFLSPAGPRKDEKYSSYVTRVAVHGALEGLLNFLLQLLQMRRPF